MTSSMLERVMRTSEAIEDAASVIQGRMYPSKDSAPVAGSSLSFSEKKRISSVPS